MKFRFLLVFIFLFCGNSLFAGTLSSEQVEKLRRGEIISEGETHRRVVWAHVAGVIDAPPAIVWEVFIDSDAWRHYEIPRLIDSRLVSQEVAQRSKKSRSAGRFYDLLQEKIFPLRDYRRVGGKWHHYAFQYYDIPWPVANRWLILKTEDDETNEKNSVYEARFSLEAGNIRAMDGTMRLTPFGKRPNRTLFDYEVTIDPAVAVPRFMVRWGVEKILPRVMGVVQRESVRRYRGVKPKTSQLLR